MLKSLAYLISDLSPALRQADFVKAVVSLVRLQSQCGVVVEWSEVR
jgi:hypothetical protein